ncbi:hypothetical protein SAMN05519103_02044 [Rhizobiales bacterium GAS113]|nr:hypothetical protein SAMN05519103_02044 [Rhizobiales bacterium GAS113]
MASVASRVGCGAREVPHPSAPPGSPILAPKRVSKMPGVASTLPHFVWEGCAQRASVSNEV